MHVPDGFINGATSLGAALVAAGGLGAALRRGAATLRERQIPFAGLAAAFVFVLQMLNFPVAAGTSGHLLGGALAAILLGPAMGITVISVVVIVQALLFADGGVTALGLNVLNMAVLTALSGWLVFRMVMWAAPKRPGVLMVATMVAAWASVVVSAAGFALQYGIGGQGGVDPGTVFAAMVGVHALIGIGEGIITAGVVGAVLAVRPDLVTGAVRHGVGAGIVRPSRVSMAAFAAAGVLVALVLVVFVAPLASGDPDGLERVAADTGFLEAAEEPVFGGPLTGYGVAGIESEALGTVFSGLVGIIATFGVGMIGVGLLRRFRSGEAGHS
ncbi:MAG TPA: energy-coupling factor ABC transporter permease [Acidimicrobiia bacterium]